MKVIDCFPFFNELDLLEIRLNELRDVVDVFVLTESSRTFSGLRKPLYFEDNKKRFEGFNIVHTVYDETTRCVPMERERRQKQYNLDYAFDNVFDHGDVIIQGDCDEIPRASVVAKVIKEDDWESYGLIMTLFYYYMNCRRVDRGVKRLMKDAQLLRPTKRIKYNVRQNDIPDKSVRNAGWHFSFLGDVQSKIEAWGHSVEYNRPPYNTEAHIEKCKKDGSDIFMRKGPRRIAFEFVEDLSCLPKFVLDNLSKFKVYIK